MIGHNSKRPQSIEDILQEQAELCSTWADAKAELEKLENSKRAILAVAKFGIEGTNAAKEDAAYKSPVYLQFIEDYAEAVRNEAYLRARRDYLNVEFDAWRTERADSRAIAKGM